METTPQETTTPQVPEAGLQEPTTEPTSAESPTGLETLPQPSPESASEGGEPGQAPTEGEPPEYTPNFEFTVKDKKLEFDEWARPFVKDKETEAKFREMFEKAHGLEEVKTHRQSLRDELNTLKTEKTQLDTSLKQLSSYVQNKDYNSFFETLKIPKEDIIRYAVDELKYQELSPEQRREIDAHRQQTSRLSELELQNQQLLEQSQQAIRSQAEFQLNSELSKPDIASIAQNYDARIGKPGAFRQEVINRGAYYETVHGQTIPAAQAVQEIVQLIGGQASTSPQASTTPQQPSPSQVVATQKTKPVIPNVQGSGSNSPYKKQPTSVEDLRKMRDQMLAQS